MRKVGKVFVSMGDWKKKYKTKPLSMFRGLRRDPSWNEEATMSINEEIYLTNKFTRVEYDIPHLQSWDALIEEIRHINRVHKNNR